MNILKKWNKSVHKKVYITLCWYFILDQEICFREVKVKNVSSVHKLVTTL